MKKILLIIALSFSIISLYAQETGQKELDHAIYLEEVEGELDQALELYQKIVQGYKNERNIVAEALYRTGLVNEKLGNKKAVGYYENLVNNYSDQSRQVAMARKRLNSIYASMNTAKEKKDLVYLSKINSLNGKVFGSISHNGKYFCAFENLNLNLYNLETGKKFPITTKGKTDSISRNALPGTWSLDDSKIAFSWHHGRDVYSLEIWERKSNDVSIAIEPGDYIYPINWSRDGNKLLVEFGPDKNVPKLGILNVQDGNRKNIIEIGPLSNDYANMSPDGNYVVFTKDSDDGDKDLYLYDSRKQSSQLISDNSSNELAFWAFDGKSIIIKSERSGNPALYQWNFENRTLVNEPLLIYDGINKGFNPVQICNNGEIILSNLHNQSSIYMAEVDFQSGKVIKKEQIIDNASGFGLISISHDGNWMAMYKRGVNSGTVILAIAHIQDETIKEIELELLTSNRKLEKPVWTPEGKIIIPIDRTFEEKPSEFVIVDPENGNMESYLPPYFGLPSFISSNSYFITLNESADSRETGIMKVNLKSEEEEMVYRSSEKSSIGSNLSLSPDGTKLLFRLITQIDDIEIHKLMVLNLNDGNTKEVFKTNTQENVFWPPTWYPDSKHIQFDMVGIDTSTGLFMDGKEEIVELDIDSGENKVLPRISIGMDESIPWRIRNIKYQIFPDGKNILYTKSNITTNFWSLKYQ